MTNNAMPHISVNAQYIKDLSFENPNVPASLLRSGQQEPKIDLSLDLNINRLPEDNFFEVEISIEAKASREEEILFIVDLKYAGIFHLMNIEEEQLQAVLAIHCPSLLFPFVRRIIADVTHDGGFQPLTIDPVDFGVLYYKKLEEQN